MTEHGTSSVASMLPDHRQAPFLHAGFWRRVAAYVIDWLVLSPVFALLYGAWLLPLALTAAWPHPDASLFTGSFLGWVGLAIVGPWLYWALLESSRWQATVGKLALGLRVTDEHGRRIGFGRASGRFFGKIVSGMILDVGYMLAGWTARKQALHDLMAGCCVVRAQGLAVYRNRGSPENAGTGFTSIRMPGWAVGLIVAVVCFVFLVPVLGIVAAIAIPAYQNHGVRAEVAQGVALTERPRALVAEYIGQRGALPADNSDLGLPRPGEIRTRYVVSVRVADGKVVVTYGNQARAAIRGNHVVFSPVGSAGKLHWQCSSPDIRERYLPGECRP